MVTYVMDASAILRYLDAEEGAARISEILESRSEGLARIIVSAIHFGEVVGVAYKRQGHPGVQQATRQLDSLGFEVIPATRDQAVRSALLKRQLKLPYADSFGIALAQELTQAIFVTADYDFKAADHLVAIEFIGPKPQLPTP